MDNERKYITHKTDESPNTGILLKAFFKKRRIHKNALARKLNRHKSNLVSFQKNSSIQTSILWEICHVLKHNFFKDIAAQLPQDFTSDAPLQTHHEEQIIALELALKIMTAERDILLKAIGS